MKRTLILMALLAALALSACQPAATRRTLEPTSPTGATAAPDGYPAPAQTLPTGYPAEGAPQGQQPQEPKPMNELWLAYPPAPADASMDRGTFFVEAAALMPSTGAAGSFDLSVEGSLPTPCNLPRVMVNNPDAQNVIAVELYSVAQSGMVCADVLQPFTGVVATLAGFPAGTYTVIINGEVEAGEFTVE